MSTDCKRAMFCSFFFCVSRFPHTLFVCRPSSMLSFCRHSSLLLSRQSLLLTTPPSFSWHFAAFRIYSCITFGRCVIFSLCFFFYSSTEMHAHTAVGMVSACFVPFDLLISMTETMVAKSFAYTVIAISFCCLWWYDLNSPRKLCASTYKQPKTVWTPTVDGLNTNSHAFCEDRNISLLSFLSYSFRSCRVCRLEWVVKLHGRCLVLGACVCRCVQVNLGNVVRLLLLYYLCLGFVSDGNDGETKKCLNTLNMQAAHCLLAQMSTLLSHCEEKDKNDANERVL